MSKYVDTHAFCSSMRMKGSGMLFGHRRIYNFSLEFVFNWKKEDKPTYFARTEKSLGNLFSWPQTFMHDRGHYSADRKATGKTDDISSVTKSASLLAKWVVSFRLITSYRKKLGTFWYFFQITMISILAQIKYWVGQDGGGK